jgi:hypothetical protein
MAFGVHFGRQFAARQSEDARIKVGGFSFVPDSQIFVAFWRSHHHERRTPNAERRNANLRSILKMQFFTPRVPIPRKHP